MRVAPTTKDNVFRSQVGVFPSKDSVKTNLLWVADHDSAMGAAQGQKHYSDFK